MDLLSPGIQTKEIDLTTVVAAASSTIAGTVGTFYWGPIGTVELISNEDDLVQRFGSPKSVYSASTTESNNVATSFMSVASYLAYSNSLRVSRVANTNDIVSANNAKNSVADVSTGVAPVGILIKNIDDYHAKDALGSLSPYFLIGKYAGALGNSVKYSACFNASQFKSPAIPNLTGDWTLNKNDAGTKTLSALLIDLTIDFSVGDYVEFTYDGNTYKNQVTIVTTTKITLADIGSSLPFLAGSATTGIVTEVKKIWQYAGSFNGVPSVNEFHLVLIDNSGNITGEVGAVLEAYSYLSVDTTKKNADGTTAYYRNVLANQSRYVWSGSASLTTVLASALYNTITKVLVNATNGTTPTQDDYLIASELFLDKDNINISTFICPPIMDVLVDATVPNYLIQNLAEVRKDIVVYLSPKYTDVVNVPGQELANVIAYRNTLPSSSYAFMDSGWKYMYDKYNNTYRWVPLAADIAGTAARTDNELDAWWSHAGLNRGGIKNCIRLAWNPNQTKRDDLYQVGINPVITQNGVGTILYGDKTLLSRPSAFDRINVRRLFIVLEKAISNSAKYSLFEFNDEITRTRFVTMIEPFLRDIKSRRGITDFAIKCDSTNNTAQVIDTNRFIGSVFIKPNRSINFITLNFVAVASGISFETVVNTI